MPQNHTFVTLNKAGTPIDLMLGRTQPNTTKTGRTLVYGEIGLSINDRLVIANTNMGYIPTNDNEEQTDDEGEQQ